MCDTRIKNLFSITVASKDVELHSACRDGDLSLWLRLESLTQRLYLDMRLDSDLGFDASEQSLVWNLFELWATVDVDSGRLTDP